MRNFLWCVVAGTVLLLSACGDDDVGNAGSGGSAGSAGFAGFAGTGGGSGGASGVGATGGDGGTAGSGATGGTGDGPWSVPALPFHVTPGTPFNAPARQWSFVGFPESKCANGTPTGIAVNPIENAVGVLVFMQGGGACWDAETCLVLKASVHLEDTVGESVVLAEAGGLSGLFDHDNVLNPFRQYAYVYMPYCTGDLHSGSQAQVYNAGTGAGDVTIQHHGGRNVELYLERLIATFPSVDRVVVSGISAGGFGATLNWWRYQGAFPNARVDILDDAGLMVDAPDTRWSAMHDAWAMAVPPGCDDCDERASAWLPFYGAHLIAPRRYALTAFLGDAVIGSYFGLSAAQIETQMLALRAGAAANQKTFFLPGTLHSVIAEGTTTMTSDGTSLLPWVLQFASDDPNWNHAGP